MNSSADPCDNFYKYACGNFELPNKSFGSLIERSHSEYGRLRAKMPEKINKMIMATLNTSKNFKPQKLIKNLYSSCINPEGKDHNSSDDIQFLRQQLMELGDWPVLKGKDWDESNFHWLKIVNSSHRMNNFYEAFLKFGVTYYKNNTHAFFFEAPSFEFSYHESTDQIRMKIDAYYNYMVRISELLGAEQQLSRKDLWDSVRFEFKLFDNIYNLTSDSSISNTTITNEMSVADIIDRWPSVDWTEFFNTTTQPFVEINNATMIILKDSFVYIENLIRILSNTPKRIQANYGLWKMTEKMVPYIKNSTIKISFRHNEMIQNRVHPTENYQCSRLVQDLLPTSIDALYVREYLDERVKPVVTKMLTEIKSKLIAILGSVGWFDEETRRNAIEKVEAIKNIVAYPDGLMDDEKIEEYYADLANLEASSFLENVVRLEKFRWKDQIEVVKLPYNVYYRTYMNYTITRIIDVNAYYLQWMNSLEIPAAELQGIFFDINRPSYINYGSMGTIIGHEIAHALSYNSRKNDKIGYLNDWWTNETDKKYRDKAQCFVNQYSNYTIEGLDQKMNGTRTLDENFAENIGVRIAYLAYQDWAKRNGPEPSLPEMSSYTSNQLFWLSYASSWCTSLLPTEIKAESEDIHPPSSSRIVGSLSNIPEFARDFNCPLGSNMNPKNKCVLF
ncbi:GSCOCG00005573001-RA-CDS [Cotesia congregata]|nr:GSCOCG00005573001-RA-CDS [Cotesia congregata]